MKAEAGRAGLVGRWEADYEKLDHRLLITW